LLGQRAASGVSFRFAQDDAFRFAQDDAFPTTKYGFSLRANPPARNLPTWSLATILSMIPTRENLTSTNEDALSMLSDDHYK
jgi:hypothetical protein